jgi:pyruvate/2-oxoglutarate dehydrogenase complex dihydrolipoamide acyltransferase (E2) component
VSEERTQPNTDLEEQMPARQRQDDGGDTAPNGGSPRPYQEEPDVLLDVENLEVEKITLEVDNLRAHISVLAELANLLNLSVGADVQLGRVKLEIDGVRAQALLKVRLENVRVILVKALETLGEHPEILENLAQTLTALLREALQDASSALGDVLEGLDVGDTVDEVLKGKLEEISSDLEGALEHQGSGAGGELPGGADGGSEVTGGTTDHAEQGVRGGRESVGGVATTEAARREAEELGVELSGVEGTGSGGRITLRDVQAAAERG